MPGAQLDATDIITQATMATTLVKMLVDLVKLCWGGETGRPPTWVPPISALSFGVLIMALLAVALDQDLTQSRTLASTILAGLMAAVGSIGITELHKLARPGTQLSGSTYPSTIVPAEASAAAGGGLLHLDEGAATGPGPLDAAKATPPRPPPGAPQPLSPAPGRSALG